jgi:predicted RNase H-like HicB family nuclease
MRNTFTAVMAQADGGGYGAYCLEVPAVGQGDTIEACRANLRAAVQRMLDDRRAVERQKAPPGAWEEVLEVEDRLPEA